MKNHYTFYTICLVILFGTPSAFAQWTPLNVIEEPPVFSEVRNTNGTLIATAFSCGVFRSDDNGASWFSISDNLPVLSWSVLAVQGNNVYIGSSHNTPYKSEDLGNTWSPMDMGLPMPVTLREFEVFGTDLYAGGSFGLVKSTDQGETWKTLEGNGLPSTVNAFDISDQGIFALSFIGVFRSTNDGADFEDISDPSLGSGFEIHSNSSRVFVYFGSFNNIYYTDDYSNWVACSGLPSSIKELSQIETFGSSIFVCGSGTFYRSDDNGATFMDAHTGIPNANLSRSMAQADNGTLVGSTFRGIYTSTDNGDNWTASNTGIPLKMATFSNMLYFQDELFMTAGRALYRSTDDGDTWTELTNGYPIDPRITGLAEHNDQLFGKGIIDVIRWNKNVDTWANLTDNLQVNQIDVLKSDGQDLYLGGFDGMYRSSDDGENWEQVNPVLAFHTEAIEFYGPFVLGGSNSSSLYRANKSSLDWTLINTGLPIDMNVLNMASNSSHIYLVGKTGIYSSDDIGDTWVRIDEEFDDLSKRRSIVVTEEFIIVSIGGGIYFSTLDNIEWEDITGNLPTVFVKEKIILRGDDLYAGEIKGIWKRSISDLFTDTNERAKGLSVSVFPNPTVSEVTILLKDAKLNAGTLSLFNANGQLIYLEEFSTPMNQFELDLTNLSSGTYLVELLAGNKKWIESILKE